MDIYMLQQICETEDFAYPLRQSVILETCRILLRLAVYSWLTLLSVKKMVTMKDTHSGEKIDILLMF